MIAFSINVASVMGKFIAVPKQAQRMFFLSNKVLVTPMEVIPKTSTVIHRAA